MIAPRTLALCLGLLMGAPARADQGLDGRLSALELEITLEPDAPLPRLRRARVLRLAGRLDQAERDLDTVAALDSELPLLHLERGLLAIAAGGDGLPDLDQHLSGPSARAEGFDARAALHEEHGRPRAALPDRQGAWVREPTPDRALALAAAFETLGDPLCAAVHLGEAETALQGAIVIRLERVRAELRAGRTTEALTAATALVIAEPRSSDRLLLRADVLQARGDHDGARADRTHALQLAEDRLSRRPTALAEAALLRARVALSASD